MVRSCRRRNVASQRHDNATTSSGDSGINATSSATSRDDNDGDEQQLAVKFVHKTLTDEQRALYEVNVMKTLEHMALLPLVATFSTPRSWIIVMPRYVVAVYTYVCCCWWLTLMCTCSEQISVLANSCFKFLLTP